MDNGCCPIDGGSQEVDIGKRRELFACFFGCGSVPDTNPDECPTNCNSKADDNNGCTCSDCGHYPGLHTKSYRVIIKESFSSVKMVVILSTIT